MIKTEKILEQVTIWPLYLAVLLTPLFFLPITRDWLEWNKHYLLGILVVVSLLAWLGNGLVSKKLVLSREAYHWPLLAFWLVLLISSILSKDQIVSFFGLADNVSGGFLAFTFYGLLAYLVGTHINSEARVNRLLLFLGLGGGLTTVYFWLGRFGLFGRLSVPRWNTIADLNQTFGVFLALLLVLALGMLLVKHSHLASPLKGEGRELWLWVWAVVAALAFLTIVALGFKLIWIAAALGSFIVLLLSFSRLEEVRYPVVSVAMVLFVISLVFAILGTPKFLSTRTSVEATLAHRSSVQITFDSLKSGAKQLLLGSGPETFVYSFSAHRPLSYNQGQLWNVRFNRPVASSYSVLGGTGIIGSIAFLLLLLVGVGMVYHGWVRRSTLREQRGLFFAVSGAWLLAVVMLFFTNYGTVLWLYFFVLLALLGITASSASDQTRQITLSLKATPQYALATSFIYIVVVAAVVVGGLFLGRFYASDVLAVRSVRAAGRQDFTGAERKLATAINLNPYRAGLEVQRSETFLLHGVTESRKEKPDGEQVGALLAAAINSSRRATNLSPLSVATWEQLARIYINARPLSKEANTWVITSLNEAVKLEPNNPRLYALRGEAYRFDQKLAEAEADFKKSAELKPNYAPAQYALSVLLEQNKDFAGAIAAAGRAVQAAPRALDAQFNLGRLLYNRNGEGDWARAEQVFRGILRVNKDYANAIYSLALLMERQDKLDEAREFYLRVLELSPSNEGVKKRLKELPAGTPKEVEAVPETLTEEESASE